MWRVRGAKPAIGMELLVDLREFARAAGSFTAGAINGL